MGDFKDLFIRAFTKKPKEEDAVVVAAKERSAEAEFHSRITAYRRTFSGYNRAGSGAPNFDYMHWKPKGSVRAENREMNYYKQSHALIDWVQSSAVALAEGREEQKWDGLVGQPKVLRNVYSRPVSRVPTRAASVELLGAATPKS